MTFEVAIQFYSNIRSLWEMEVVQVKGEGALIDTVEWWSAT